MIRKKMVFPLAAFCFAWLFVFSWAEFVKAQEISPAQEQEFADAKGALEAALKVQANKFAAEPIQKAQDLLTAASGARTKKDPVKFTQASRLARAYAELGKAIAELRMEEEKLATTQEQLQKAKDEIERLKKSQ